MTDIITGPATPQAYDQYGYFGVSARIIVCPPLTFRNATASWSTSRPSPHSLQERVRLHLRAGRAPRGAVAITNAQHPEGGVVVVLLSYAEFESADQGQHTRTDELSVQFDHLLEKHADAAIRKTAMASAFDAHAGATRPRPVKAAKH